ncbi:hypothetical protein PHYSODRAFT_341143 [Phytophthora sojae]|uniref:Alpha/beta hydrolase fold-3 domain-containing protein n=1 Tax=Phytophthora sojae (strain P6497) TaxID=1094619 RepID=G5ACB4_PHYSP|nr:hypothetical protein PHYSODRAFT_341143 [Phytophthora sojae]EGZ06988.1 hypothetical protein PHYSODRAFT_341143 [Phytophthora sojae]|eukprot:XP_009537752.1 hypothetical protein PHYSODRAFT_341143 [Phytophthora sojae]
MLGAVLLLSLAILHPQLFAWAVAIVALLSVVWMLLFAGFCATPWEAWKLTSNALLAVTRAYGDYRSRGAQPLLPSWTLQFELLTAAMRVCTRTFGHRIVLERHARYIRRQSEVVGTLRGWVACWCHGTMEGVTVNGLEHLWLRAKREQRARKNRFVVMYVHGGGYAALSPRFHIDFCVTLAGESMRQMNEKLEVDMAVGVDAFLVNYRKAPEHRHPAAEKDVLAMYDYLLSHENLRPEQIIRGTRGTSRLPLAAILACPVVDIATLCEGEDVDAEYCILSKPMMQAIGQSYLSTPEARAAWRRSSSALNPDHDLSELPPVFVQAGERDYLLPQAQTLVEKAKEIDGASNWELDVHEDMPHVFTSSLPSYYRALTSKIVTTREHRGFHSRCLLADYRKLPEHNFPAPMEDAVAMYNYLIKEWLVSPKNIILAGDSAGAGLVLSTLHRLKDAGVELPLGAVCASPMINWPSKEDISKDCFVQTPLLAGIRDFSVSSGSITEEICSLNFDMQDFPPIFVQTGEKDLLHDQAKRLYTKARSEGNLQFKQWLKQGETPESVTKGNFDERGTGVVLSCYDFNKANS